MRAQGLALSFDDVLLQPGYSAVAPHEVSTNTLFSRNVPLNIPIVSAAMDTVTESRMAISMAKLGGLGIIHRKLSPEAQASEVRRVKSHLHGLISDPVCVRETMTVEALESMRREKQFGFHSFPVVDEHGKLIGIVTKDDLEFCDTASRELGEIMTSKGLVTARVGTTLDEAYTEMGTKRKKLLPLINEKGFIGGLYVWSDVKRIKLGNSKGFNTDKGGQLRVGAAIGTGEKALERLALLVNAGVDVVVIDTAHGDSKQVYETLDAVKTRSSVDVVVGNISLNMAARRLWEKGADGIKVGQGAGSTCTTRIVSGAGAPQVTAVYECANELKGLGIPVTSDGGKRYSGHITTAIGAGADAVMLGRMLAGTDQAPGEIITINGKLYKALRGMGSLGVMESSAESRDRYRQLEFGKDKLVPEGIEGVIPYQGDVERLIFQYVGGLRAGMGYVGAHSIEALKSNAGFQRITSGGLAESHPHDITITKDAPNYRRDELRLSN